MARGTYAIRACDYCGLQLHANELIPVTDRTLSGTRQGSRTYISSKTFGGGSSRSDYYRISHLKVCPSCAQAREERLRRESHARFGGYAIIAAVVIGLIFWFSNYASAPDTTANEAGAAVENQTAPEKVVEPTMPASASDAASNSVESDRDDSRGDGAAPVLREQPTPDDSAASTPQPADDQQAIANAINDVTPEALTNERPVKWMAAGRSGYVVPSAAQSYGDQTCRNVYATTIYGGDQKQSATVRWCRSSDSADWHLAAQ